MLASSAAKGCRQALEAAALIIGDACVHQRLSVLQVLAHARMLPKIVDHRRVFAGKGLEAFLASRIGQAADIEYKSAAVASFVLGRSAAVERKAENLHHKILCCDRLGFGRD